MLVLRSSGELSSPASIIHGLSSRPLTSPMRVAAAAWSSCCFSYTYRALSHSTTTFIFKPKSPSRLLFLSNDFKPTPSPPPHKTHCFSSSPLARSSSSSSAAVEDGEAVGAAPFIFDNIAAIDLKSSPPPPPPPCEVKELEELPEQWRRSKLAWLCKELPSHKPATLIRILNGQRKWITQDDTTYVVVHFLRIRENEASFRVYKWMVQQHWFHFDFALATKLADFLGKDRKVSKCREMFNEMVTQGRVPCESTFHILIVAYLSAPVHGNLEEACAIYNRMIQLGGYKPRLSLHNSLFRAIASKPGGSSKYFLKQAEFIFHNLVTSELEIHKDIYAGLIWLHSYQDIIDRERISALRGEMQQAGIQEGSDVLVSIMRAYSKEGDVQEVEKAWHRLLDSGFRLPSQAFVYRMEVYTKVGEPMKSLGIFKGMNEQSIPPSVVAYHKIIEIMSKAQEIDIAESLMSQFIESGMKPLMPSYIDMTNAYFKLGLHDKLKSTFSQCLEKCHPNQTIYNIYLDSLVETGNIEKAEEIFNEMQMNAAIGVNGRSCNIILGGYLASEQSVKAEKIYDMMCRKKYDIETPLMEKVEHVLSSRGKVVKKPIRLKLDKEQREILIGLLLSGAQIESDEVRRNHAIHFEFNEQSEVHRVLKMHLHDRYYEWLNSHSRLNDGNDQIPYRLSTIAHSSFDFYADHFWSKGRSTLPKLIHRWLSARVLAYWYMYGGHRTSSGDILLKLKGGSREDLVRIVKTLKAKSLDCKAKRKGRVFWIGFQGSNAVWFWKLAEPYILDSLKDILKPDGRTLGNGAGEDQEVSFHTESDSDENASDYNEDNVFDSFQDGSMCDGQD